MPIELSIETQGAPERLIQLLGEVADACFRVEGVPVMEAAGRLVDGETIRALNRDFRGIDRETDVLSFPAVTYAPGRTARNSPKRLGREYNPQTGLIHIGDFALSLPRAEAQAREYGHSLARELGYLTAHSMFHLMGYDHEDEGERAVMREMEEKAMALVSLTRPEDGDRELFERACAALQNAYAPYSRFRVGACIRAEDGRLFDGCNIENASYGATICAERCAVSRAVSQGARKFSAIAVVGETDKAWPCGICRQVLNEFGPAMRVLCGSAASGAYEVTALPALLPHGFGPDALGIGPQ